jgi:hypothetical protein
MTQQFRAPGPLGFPSSGLGGRLPGPLAYLPPFFAAPNQVKNSTSQTLGALKISARDPFAAWMLPHIDAAFQRNKTYAVYLKQPLDEGRKINDPKRVIVHTTTGTYRDAYENYVGQRVGGSLPAGFYWESQTRKGVEVILEEIHLPPEVTFGTVFHEAVHKMSNLHVLPLIRDDKDFAEKVNEGLTSWFAKNMLAEEGVNDYLDGYAFPRAAVQKLIDALDLDPVAKWYWTGDRRDLLRKLGVTPRSANESKQAIEKLKKIMK